MNPIFDKYKIKIDSIIEDNLSKWNLNLPLSQVCRYALTQGGKRFRPAIVLMISEAIGKNWDVSSAAFCIECFHTASLIADDLPSMDNDAMRRGKPSTHIKFGEAEALLASYALISEGYQAIVKNVEAIRKKTSQADHIGMLALQHASKNTGILGATGGQYLDLFPHSQDEGTYKETIFKKTVTLFEISLVLGWLFGGGDQESLPLVKRAAYHYGMAFQMADDWDDALSDEQGERTMNICTLFGEEKAREMIETELNAYLLTLEVLDIHKSALAALVDFIKI